jgi:hypothetical protein
MRDKANLFSIFSQETDLKQVQLGRAIQDRDHEFYLHFKGDNVQEEMSENIGAGEWIT